MAQLVGRFSELARLDALLADLGRPGVPTVVDLVGEPGIGKSRLLGEVCARARRSGCTVLRGRATEYEQHVPFQVFADALADLEPVELLEPPASAGTPDADSDPAGTSPAAGCAASSVAGPAAGSMAGSGYGAGYGSGAGSAAESAVHSVLHRLRHAPGVASDRDGAARFEVHRAIGAFLARLGERGLVLAMDDLHWADPASRELVDHLIRHPAHGRVLLVVARRARQTPTSLTAALTRGADDGAVLHIALEPLPEQESLHALASDVPEDHARRLYAASEGNPLYLLSLVHAYRDGTPLHTLTAPVGAPADASAAVGVPSGLAALLLDELTALTGPQRRLVDAVAVLGDHATPPLLTVATGLPLPDVEDQTGALAARDVLRAGPGGRWALRHPLVRALVYEHMAPGPRAEVHRRAARELARGHAPVTERAHHVERSLTGWDPKAADVLVEAAAQFASTAPATAAHLLDAVLTRLPDTPDHTRRRGELLLARARALGVSGSPRESRALLHALIETAGKDHPELRTAAVAQCAVMERHLGHSPEATALLRRELSRSPAPSPGHEVSLRLSLGMSALLTASYPQVRADVAQAAAVARHDDDPTGEAAALALAALGEAYEGETAAAEGFADAACALTDALTDPGLTDLCEALVWLAWAETLLERYADAERHITRGLDIARRSGQLAMLPHLLTSQAFVRLTTCRLPSALEAAEEAESIARAVGGGDLLAFTLAIKTLVLLLARPFGDGSALATAEEAVATTGGTKGWWSALAWCMLGHATYVAGDPHRAQEAVMTAGGGRDLPLLQPSIRPGQLDTLVNAALAAGDVAQARRWAAQAAREADRLGLSGQRAAALRAEAALAEHHGDTGEAVRLLDAATEEYVRCGQPLWEAYSLLRAAPLVRRTGQGPRAAAMWRRAHRIAVDGGARLLVDLAELTRPQMTADAPALPAELAELTARELEVAELVAAGLSNQDIAARLHLSRRTVETHLSAVYRKASVPSRSALAGLLTRLGLGAGPGRTT
ncbi:AAA family ATPase [Streptomyces sp. NBC_01275]|uniref:helix-turn-helix transcriptional regulator n=1 Tax=Streptomyces sp. NBC_01275 TaxID=2903807 RepID=UPI00224E6FAC|nr:AAA family ATPase [Streptomyces sp. NBC_01275]MCX4760253.1 AAA family ATPase [Streptomyces sp. NBC_01275]